MSPFDKALLTNHYRHEAQTARNMARLYEFNKRDHLSRLWGYLAAYYDALANDQDASEYDQFDDLDAVVKRIDTLIDRSLPANISKRSMGGFGYHGDTPIGENWAIVATYAPNVASLLDESNWKAWQSELSEFDEDMTIEWFSSWVTGTENLMVRLIEDSGKPTNAAIVVIELLTKLENYPILDDDDLSQRESVAEYDEQCEVIRGVMHNSMIVPTHQYNDIPRQVINWLYENDQNALDKASYGYSDSGGYGLDEAAVLGALYALELLDRSEYDDSEWDDIESVLADYIWGDIKRGVNRIRF